MSSSRQGAWLQPEKYLKKSSKSRKTFVAFNQNLHKHGAYWGHGGNLKNTSQSSNTFAAAQGQICVDVCGCVGVCVDVDVWVFVGVCMGVVVWVFVVICAGVCGVCG